MSKTQHVPQQAKELAEKGYLLRSAIDAIRTEDTNRLTVILKSDLAQKHGSTGLVHTAISHIKMDDPFFTLYGLPREMSELLLPHLGDPVPFGRLEVPGRTPLFPKAVEAGEVKGKAGEAPSGSCETSLGSETGSEVALAGDFFSGARVVHSEYGE